MLALRCKDPSNLTTPVVVFVQAIAAARPTSMPDGTWGIAVLSDAAVPLGVYVPQSGTDTAENVTAAFCEEIVRLFDGLDV